tara:strand:- start:1884 stop:2453 length:570 start_codon:yes stop_codon:yes gene_type:complete
MANSTATIQQAEINTLETEGKALAKEYKSITKGDENRFTKATKADGFDTRLGKLMQKLKAEGGERISTDRLKDCGINVIDKRRRSEALWFVENEKACREFIAKSKKGFTSLTALQVAMKPKAPSKPKAETPVEPKAEDKSNVGLDNNVVVPVDAMMLALQLIEDCEKNNVVLQDVLDLVSAKSVQKAVA